MSKADDDERFTLKQLISLAASIALLISFAEAADAKTSKKAQRSNSPAGFAQRDVRLQSPSWSARPPNADLKYGPQPYYPQSPPGGGY